MRDLLIGTTNPAKLTQLRSVLAAVGIQARSAAEVCALPDVPEDGTAPEDNARRKAQAFAAAAGRPVLAMDAALDFDGLPRDQQPGVHVRRLGRNGQRPDDETLLGHYRMLCRRHGGQLTGTWRLAICIATAWGGCHEHVQRSRRLFLAEGTRARRVGYPLDSLQFDPMTGRYVADMDPAEALAFWRRTVGAGLAEFVRRTLPTLESPAASEEGGTGSAFTSVPESDFDRRLYDHRWSRQGTGLPPVGDTFTEMLGALLARGNGRRTAPPQMADLGCGGGRHAVTAARRGVAVVAVDRNATAIASLRERAAGMPRLRPVQADFGTWMQATDQRFDAVVCWDALHHLSADEAVLVAALRLMRARLHPGGYLLLSLLCDVESGTGATGEQFVTSAAAGHELLDRACADLRLLRSKQKRLWTDRSIGVDRANGQVVTTTYAATRVVKLFQG